MTLPYRLPLKQRFLLGRRTRASIPRSSRCDRRDWERAKSVLLRHAFVARLNAHGLSICTFEEITVFISNESTLAKAASTSRIVVLVITKMMLVKITMQD